MTLLLKKAPTLLLLLLLYVAASPAPAEDTEDSLKDDSKASPASARSLTSKATQDPAPFESVQEEAVPPGCPGPAPIAEPLPSKPGTSSKVEAWQGYALSLLCNHKGSISERVKEIFDRLKKAYPSDNWYVFISDDNEGWAFYKVKGVRDYQKDTSCGYDMYLWKRPDKYFDTTRCSSTTIKKVTTLVRGAAARGGGHIAVRDELVSELKTFGLSYSMFVVTNYPAKYGYAERELIYKSCWIDITESGYRVRLYLAT